MLLRTTTDPIKAVNTKDESFFEDLGVRVAEARKERNRLSKRCSRSKGAE